MTINFILTKIEFLELYEPPSTTGEMISKCVLDVLHASSCPSLNYVARRMIEHVYVLAIQGLPNKNMRKAATCSLRTLWSTLHQSRFTEHG